MKRAILYLCAAAVVAEPGLAQPPACPRPNAAGWLVFADGSIATRTGLSVNADGTSASYTPGNHGYTYINNGVNLIDRGRRVACSERANTSRCNTDWAAAESRSFGPGTPEFCVFAMEVEPYTPGARRVNCEGDRSRYVVGNGKGRPRFGPPVPTIMGGMVTPYLSTTSLTHTVNGRVAYIDAATIPALVAARDQGDLLGAIAWVRYQGHSSFAIVGDTGRRFGEGSVALHRMLRSGEIGPFQAVGPIPRAARCGPTETGLRLPFVSKPDDGEDDLCRPGYTVGGDTDVRAYEGIARDVDVVIFPAVRPPMDRRTVTQEVTLGSLQELAEARRLTPDILRQRVACLGR